MKLKRYLTVTPMSGMQSLATFHLCHTSMVPLAINLMVLNFLGVYHIKHRGLPSFLRIFAIGAAAASVAVAINARTNPK
jgi:hypothetical protein